MPREAQYRRKAITLEDAAMKMMWKALNDI